MVIFSRPGEFWQPSHIINKKKEKSLVPYAEVSATEMVLCKEFTGRAEAAYLSH